MNCCRLTAMKHDIVRVARLAGVPAPNFSQWSARDIRQLYRALGLHK